MTGKDIGWEIIPTPRSDSVVSTRPGTVVFLVYTVLCTNNNLKLYQSYITIIIYNNTNPKKNIPNSDPKSKRSSVISP